jgi:two-component system, OmpR family, sensor histidine kinase KdpD
MSISSRIQRVRPEDLLDDGEPAERLPRLAVSGRRQLAGLVLALVLLPLVTLLLEAAHDSVSLETVVLVYLLAVVVVAMVGGVIVAVAAAVAAALLINFFFIEPVHTLTVARGEQALALGVFVIVAAVVSGAVELATRRARAAEQAAAEAEALLSLAGTDLDGEATLKEVLDGARRTFHMESVALKARDHESGRWSDVEHSGWAPRGREAPLRFDVPINPELRLLGRGPALFAEDQRVLHAFAAAAETAYEGRRLSARAREAQALAAVDRQRTALLAAVGHDLRTPLASIKAAVSTLRQTDVHWTPDEQAALLATIEDSADRLDSVVANLLDASRLEAGALAVTPQPVALVEVVGRTLLALGSDASRVRVDVPEQLPLVQADAGLLERILANLLDNALRHGGADEVEVTATAGAENAKLAIVDHGPGVAAADRERLFVPFQRLDDHSGGVGLGLAVAKGLAEAMAGALIADASPGGGLTMRLRLPLATTADVKLRAT